MDSVDRSPAVTLLLKRMESHPEEFVLVFDALASGGSTAQRKWIELITTYKPYMTNEEIAAIDSKFNSIQMDEMHRRIMSTLLNEAFEGDQTVTVTTTASSVTTNLQWEHAYLRQVEHAQAQAQAQALLQAQPPVSNRGQAQAQSPVSNMGMYGVVGRFFGWGEK